MMLRGQWVMALSVLFGLIAGPAIADDDSDSDRQNCASRKINATGGFYQCISREAADAVRGDFDRDRSCDRRLERRFARAERGGHCQAESDADTIGAFLEEVQHAVDDTIVTGAALPHVNPPECNPADQNLLDFDYYANQDGFWCGEATATAPDGEPWQINAFPYPYANYKIFIRVQVDGPNLNTKTLVIYPPEAPARCDEIEAAGFPNSLAPGGECGVNGAGKVYIGDEVASDCDGGLMGLFPLGQLQFLAESTLLSDRIQAYRQETQAGDLILDDISTIQDDAWVLTGQTWNPLRPPGIGQLEMSFFDRMTKCSEIEFYGEIAYWGQEFDVPEGQVCGLDSGNNPTNQSCQDFFGESDTP